MSDQLHIRDPETVARVRTLAKASGLTMRDVVRTAVRKLEPEDLRKPQLTPEELMDLLRKEQVRLRAGSKFDLDDFYDPATGLPV